MELFGNVRPAPQDLDIIDTFNYGMAEWAKTGKPSEDMFERVVDLDNNNVERQDANYHQCLAIALWIIGRKRDALERIIKAKKLIVERPTPQFSCWRYMQVTPIDFQEDCESIRNLIDGKKIYPTFFPKENEGLLTSPSSPFVFSSSIYRIKK